jgi:hypothetical protein
MEVTPQTFEGVERYIVISVLTILSVVSVVGLFEHRVLQSFVVKLNERELGAIAYLIIALASFSLFRAIYLGIKKRRNSLLYAAIIPASFLSLIPLGTVIE